MGLANNQTLISRVSEYQETGQTWSARDKISSIDDGYSALIEKQMGKMSQALASLRSDMGIDGPWTEDRRDEPASMLVAHSRSIF